MVLGAPVCGCTISHIGAHILCGEYKCECITITDYKEVSFFLKYAIPIRVIFTITKTIKKSISQSADHTMHSQSTCS